MQRLSVAIQLGNAACILCNIADDDFSTEFGVNLAFALLFAYCEQWCMSRSRSAASALPQHFEASPRSSMLWTWPRLCLVSSALTRGIGTFKLRYGIIIDNFHAIILFTSVFPTFKINLHLYIKQRFVCVRVCVRACVRACVCRQTH